jgi:hypothetical protein
VNARIWKGAVGSRPLARRAVAPVIVLCCVLVVQAITPPGHVGARAEQVPTATTVQAASTYTNPVVSGLSANPFVLKSGSTYYAYVNGFDYFLPLPVMALSSTDLVTWTQVGNVLPPASAGAWADTSSGWRFSSPSVRHIPLTLR